MYYNKNPKIYLLFSVQVIYFMIFLPFRLDANLTVNAKRATPAEVVTARPSVALMACHVEAMPNVPE
jgi:hypothetical protein